MISAMAIPTNSIERRNESTDTVTPPTPISLSGQSRDTGVWRTYAKKSETSSALISSTIPAGKSAVRPSASRTTTGRELAKIFKEITLHE